jgi:hypothetical protein
LAKFHAGAFELRSVQARSVAFDDASRGYLKLIQPLDQRGFEESTDMRHERSVRALGAGSIGL